MFLLGTSHGARVYVKEEKFVAEEVVGNGVGLCSSVTEGYGVLQPALKLVCLGPGAMIGGH